MTRRLRTVDKNGGIELIHEELDGTFIEDLGQRTAPATHLTPGPSFASDLDTLRGLPIAWNENGVKYKEAGDNSLSAGQVTSLVTVCLTHDSTDPRPENTEETALANIVLFMATWDRTDMTAARGRTLYDEVLAAGLD